MRRQTAITSAMLFAGAVLMAAPLSARAQGGEEARPISLAEAIKQAVRNAPAAVQARGSSATPPRPIATRSAPTCRRSTSPWAPRARRACSYFQGALIPLTGNPWNYNNGHLHQLQLFDGWAAGMS